METFEFQAEINQLMHLIINAFYSNKDVFLRELVSNASDALDKIRHKSLTDPNALESNPDLKIQIRSDKENKILEILDSGVGMTRKELIENLGTIAKSGTKLFAEMLKEQKNDESLIGQFGVGFYSAFLVAEKVQVITKHNSEEKVHLWESDSKGTFAVGESDVDLRRGTIIRIYLKDDQTEYLEEKKIRGVIEKHSQFVNYNIELYVEKEKEVDDIPEEPEDTEDPDNDRPVIEEINEDDEKKDEKKTKTVKYNEYEVINKVKPIWTQDPSDVTDDQYAEFYKTISNDWSKHMKVKHFKMEGMTVFRAILFIPEHPPFDMFQQSKKENSIKLYANNVLITDDCKDLFPEYLGFMKGVVDCNDIPLNVSRELLQQNRFIKIIKKQLVKKSIEMFNDIAKNKEEYEKFYNNFAKNIKLGIHEDSANRNKLVDLLRFESLESPGKTISLDDYVSRMPEHQKNIYYITGESTQTVRKSPFMEIMKKKGFDVLFLVQVIDEYAIQQVKQYKDKDMVCITKEGIEFEKSDDEKEKGVKHTEEFKTILPEIKKILGDKVEKILLSERLVDAPAILATGQHGWSANMERIVKAQAMQNEQMHFMSGKKILEINPTHPLIRSLLDDDNMRSGTWDFTNVVNMIYCTALLASGFTIEDPAEFSHNLNKIMLQYYCGIETNAKDLTDTVTDAVADTVIDAVADTVTDNDSDSMIEDVDSLRNDELQEDDHTDSLPSETMKKPESKDVQQLSQNV